MAWEAYYEEIIKAKEEYELMIKPLLEALEDVKRRAWTNYLRKIVEAEKILKEVQL